MAVRNSDLEKKIDSIAEDLAVMKSQVANSKMLCPYREELGILTKSVPESLERIENHLSRLNGHVQENQINIATQREQMIHVTSKLHNACLDIVGMDDKLEERMAEMRASFVSMRDKEIEPIKTSVSRMREKSGLWGALSGGGLIAVVEFLKAYLIH